MHELEQLKKLVLEGGFEDESIQYVRSLEEKYHRQFVAQKLAENSIIQEFLKDLETIIENINQLLLNDRTLTERERDKLFERRDVCKKFAILFTDNLSQEINDALNSAKAQI
jgi:hypothetical protein